MKKILYIRKAIKMDEYVNGAITNDEIAQILNKNLASR
jgi:hypothetical protein